MNTDSQAWQGPAFPTSATAFWLTFSVWWALLGLFHLFPAWDIAVSHYFFTPFGCSGPGYYGETCGAFLDSQNAVLDSLRSIFLQLPFIAAIVLVVLLLQSAGRGKALLSATQIRHVKATLVSLLIGAGLLVNLFLKAFAGRPRPRDTHLFAGSLDFASAGSFAGKCLSNCSFISGEAASAGWLFCLILLLPARWRRTAGLPIALLSIFIPALRVSFGAHYLSDAVLGWLLSVVVFFACLALSDILANASPAKTFRQLGFGPPRSELET